MRPKPRVFSAVRTTTVAHWAHGDPCTNQGLPAPRDCPDGHSGCGTRKSPHRNILCTTRGSWRECGGVWGRGNPGIVSRCERQGCPSTAPCGPRMDVQGQLNSWKLYLLARRPRCMHCRRWHTKQRQPNVCGPAGPASPVRPPVLCFMRKRARPEGGSGPGRANMRKCTGKSSGRCYVSPRPPALEITVQAL